MQPTPSDAPSSLAAPMAPPWLAFPSYSQYCLGWRMGSGEQYLHEFRSWRSGLPTEDREGYEEMFPRPAFWHEDGDEDEDTGAEEGPVTAEWWRTPFWGPDGAAAHDWAAASRSWQRGETRPLRFFWKPRPGATDEACLGQWQPTPFTLDGETFACAEQFMMAMKADLFGDAEATIRIMASDEPGEMKALGKKVAGFDQERWDAVKYSIVLLGNWLKFTQDPHLRSFLLATGDDLLVEASPYDRVWGIGLGAQEPRAGDPRTWRGQNLLGFALMEVRAEIRRVYAHEARLTRRD